MSTAHRPRHVQPAAEQATNDNAWVATPCIPTVAQERHCTRQLQVGIAGHRGLSAKSSRRLAEHSAARASWWGNAEVQTLDSCLFPPSKKQWPLALSSSWLRRLSHMRLSPTASCKLSSPARYYRIVVPAGGTGAPFAAPSHWIGTSGGAHVPVPAKLGGRGGR